MLYNFPSTYVFATLVALLLSAVTVQSEAAEGVRQTCKNNTEGPRKSTQCTFSRTEPGMAWKGSAKRARKLFVSKPDGDTGQDVVRLWIDDKPAGEFILNPGESKHIFLKQGESTIVARAEVETLQTPNSGKHAVYVHFETLDAPKMPDLSKCMNTATADRQSVCWTGVF